MRIDIVRLTCLLCTAITHFKAPLSELNTKVPLVHKCKLNASYACTSLRGALK